MRRSSPSSSRAGLEVLAHLLAGLLGELFGLLDLFVIQLQLFLDTRVAQEHAEVAETSEASAWTLCSDGTGEDGQKAQTEEGSQHRSHGVLLRGKESSE